MLERDNLFESTFTTFSYYAEISTLNTMAYCWTTMEQLMKLLFWKYKKIRWTNDFTTQMFHFSNFAQKTNFEQPQFQKVDVALPEFFLFVFSSLLVLEESCFKAPKALLDEYFCH